MNTVFICSRLNDKCSSISNEIYGLNFSSIQKFSPTTVLRKCDKHIRISCTETLNYFNITVDTIRFVPIVCKPN